MNSVLQNLLKGGVCKTEGGVEGKVPDAAGPPQLQSHARSQTLYEVKEEGGQDQEDGIGYESSEAIFSRLPQETLREEIPG